MVISPPSIARNSFARLASDAGHLIFAFFCGVITARWLEPDGKGAYAALMSLVMIFASMSSLGLGDASVILMGRGEATFRRMSGTILGPVVVASGIGALALSILAGFQLADQGPTLGHSILVAALAVPTVCLWNVFGAVANGRELIVHTSAIRVFVHAATFLGLLLFVVVLGLYVTGGMLAFMTASLAGFVAVAILVVRKGGEISFAFDRKLLRSALRLGLVIELGHSILVLGARVDVLFVYSMIGRAAAGRYSVALTVGQLVASASLAISFALFPRIAKVAEQDRYPLIAKASRIGVAVSLISALILVVVIPVILPWAFGTAYRGSVLPALILLIGGISWAEQQLLSTARTAQGRTRLQLVARASTLATTVVLDLVLIPLWGINGAAIAAALAPLVGLAACIYSYRKDIRDKDVSLKDLLPGREDFIFVFRSVPGLLGRKPR